MTGRFAGDSRSLGLLLSLCGLSCIVTGWGHRDAGERPGLRPFVGWRKKRWVAAASVGRKPLEWAILLGWSQERPGDVLVGGSSGPLFGGSGEEGTLPLPRSLADGP